MGLHPESSVSDIRQAIVEDKFLLSFYEEVYKKVSQELARDVSGPTIEIGSGTGIGKFFIPDLVATDVVMNEFLDMEVDGTALPFSPASVANYVLVNSFHHLPVVTQFLKGVDETLQPGGRLIIVDPYWGPLASVIYSVFHREPFWPLSLRWDFNNHNPWASNQALAWIVFRRGSKQFSKMFPSLVVKSIQPFSGLSYLLSGGVFGRTGISSHQLVRLASKEATFGYWYRPLRLFVELVVEKKQPVEERIHNEDQSF